MLSDLCVHRGGALSQGRVDGERIACPYHGWQYRTDGTCALIPAQPQRTVPPKARVDAYPVTERFGIVWAFLGDLPEQECPPLPQWPERDEPGRRRIQGEFSWAAHVDRVVEGGPDVVHGPFVHRGTFGRSPRPRSRTSRWTRARGRPGPWTAGAAGRPGRCPRRRSPTSTSPATAG